MNRPLMRLSNDELISDRYRITGFTEAAPDADVYDAVDERFHRHVAIKVFTAEPSDAATLTQEAGMLDGGVHNGQRFAVLAVFEPEPVVDDATAAMPAVATRAVPIAAEREVVARRGEPRRSVAPIVIGVLVAAVLIGVLALALGQHKGTTQTPSADSTTTQPTTPTTTRRTQVTTRVTTPPSTTPPATEPPTTEVTTPPATSPPPTEPPVTAASSETPTTTG